MIGSVNGEQPLLDYDFTHADLPVLRHVVAMQAVRAGLAGMRWDDFVLTVHEGAVNAVGHGGGSGRIRVWRHGGLLCCEISDNGPGTPPACQNPAVLPDLDGISGRGLWLITQLADRFSVTDGDTGTLLQIAFRLPS